MATDTILTPNTRQVRGIAYDRNEGASLTTLYAYEFSTDTLATIGGIDGNPSPNGGVINTLNNASGISPLGQPRLIWQRLDKRFFSASVSFQLGCIL